MPQRFFSLFYPNLECHFFFYSPHLASLSLGFCESAKPFLNFLQHIKNSIDTLKHIGLTAPLCTLWVEDVNLLHLKLDDVDASLLN